MLWLVNLGFAGGEAPAPAAVAEPEVTTAVSSKLRKVSRRKYRVRVGDRVFTVRSESEAQAILDAYAEAAVTPTVIPVKRLTLKQIPHAASVDSEIAKLAKLEHERYQEEEEILIMALMQ